MQPLPVLTEAQLKAPAGALQPLGSAARSLVTRSEAIGLPSLVLKLTATVRAPPPATALTVPVTDGVTVMVSLLPDVPAALESPLTEEV